MQRYSLVKHNDDTSLSDRTEIIYNFDGTTLDDMLDAFTHFLRACGFVINSDEAIVVHSEDEK